MPRPRPQPGDVILIYPREGGQPYEKTAVFVRQKDLTFRGVPAKGAKYVKISGKGFDYSGAGSTPRAIFQFNPGTDGCALEGFELSAAHNDSHNGAGVRINQANHVTVRNCSIHDNDMGIMSNGDGSLTAAVNQRIEHCEIHHNGDPADPGYNHNLYLGGTSVTLRFCEVHHSLTGHNVKSRAHHTRVEYCYIHDSANREFDLVDAADTAQPDSHAVLLGNVIVKDPQCAGNRTAIHFGQDGGKSTTARCTWCSTRSSRRSSRRWSSFRAQGEGQADGQHRLRRRHEAEQADGRQRAERREAGQRDRHAQLVQRRFRRRGQHGPRRQDQPLPPCRRADVRQSGRSTTTGSSPTWPSRPFVRLQRRKLVVPAVVGATQTAADKPLAWQYAHPLRAEKRTDKAGLTLGACGR